MSTGTRSLTIGIPASDYSELFRYLTPTDSNGEEQAYQPLYPRLEAPSAPLPAVPMLTAFHHFDDLQQGVDPVRFRNPYQGAAYRIYRPDGPSSLPGSLSLKSMTNVLEQNIGFDPSFLDFNNNPMHCELKKISDTLLSHYSTMTLTAKMQKLESAVAEIIYETIPEAYRDAQLHIYEQTPRYELLEIALRNHLLQGILQEQRELVQKSYQEQGIFPSDLGAREVAVYTFATKNNFYVSPIMDPLHLWITPQTLLEQVKESVVSQAEFLSRSEFLNQTIKSYNEHIQKTFQSMQLEPFSHFSCQLEYAIREAFVATLIRENGSYFRERFYKHGADSFEEIQTAGESLHRFLSKDFQTDPSFLPEIAMLVNIFDIDFTQQNPFETVLNKVETNKQERLRALENHKPKKTFRLVDPFVKKFRELKYGKPATKQEIETYQEELAIRQKALIEAARSRISQLCNPLEYVAPSAPLWQEDESRPPSRAATANPLPQPVPLFSEPVQSTSAPIRGSVQPSPIPVARQSFVALTPSIEKRTYRAIDLDIPLVSYTNSVFKELFKPGQEKNSWNQLSALIQLDVLRHTDLGCSGRAEAFARAHFQTTTRIAQEINRLKKTPKPTQAMGVSDEFVKKGEAFLILYYDRPHGTMDWRAEIEKLPLEPLFLKYVYELAKEAGVVIEAWDTEFAKYNWHHPGMIALSVQALERCLHTTQRA